MASFVQLVDDQGVKVLCTGAQPTSDAAGLRCRFGTVEVPARIEPGGIISCCAPDPQEFATDTVPLVVLEQDRVLAQDVYDVKSIMANHTGALEYSSESHDQSGDAQQQEEGVSKQEAEPKGAKAQYQALKPFVIISLAYLLFTTTDGAVRMIVLLHAYNMGFTAWEVAIMFTAYELMGVFTNLAAGMMGARWGIKWTLISGLSIQLVGLSILYAWQPSWSKPQAIIFVTCAQALCGVAKDLTKLGGKTVTKLVTPDEKQSQLFKLVAMLTGWKNSLKGLGYFLGAACLSFHYYFALGVLLALILAAMPWAIVGLSSQLGRARSKNLTLRQIFQQRYNVNVLSVSRFFLFGSRDMWFEVPLPFFLRDAAIGLGWSRTITGLFLAVWIIIYGQVQSWAPQLVLQPLRQSPANKYVMVFWNLALCAAPLFMGCMVQASPVFKNRDVPGMTGVMVGGLGAFCLLFAINSSIHSYLIVRYADGDKVAMNIGFYYCANALGRLTGTLVSGALYSFVGSSPIDGFAACFWASFAFSMLSWAVEVFLKDNSGGLQLGPCLTLIKAPLQADNHEYAATPITPVTSITIAGCEGFRPAGKVAEGQAAVDLVSTKAVV